MKFPWRVFRINIFQVAPFTGAWIEIMIASSLDQLSKVAPFTGAWIEIEIFYGLAVKYYVAPFTGAWIEIVLT